MMLVKYGITPSALFQIVKHKKIKVIELRNTRKILQDNFKNSSDVSVKLLEYKELLLDETNISI